MNLLLLLLESEQEKLGHESMKLQNNPFKNFSRTRVVWEVLPCLLK
jgi:hypothetical protein